VDFVEIGVQITGRDGKPIKGLKQDQFTVTENGKAQKVSTFEYNDIEKIETASAANEAPITVPIGERLLCGTDQGGGARPRMIVLFFDLTSLQPEDLLRSTRAAEKYLREQMTPADLVGVVAFGNTLKVVANFTNDREFAATVRGSLDPGHEAALAQLAMPPPPQTAKPVSPRYRRGVHGRRHRIQRFQYRPETGRDGAICEVLEGIPARNP